MIVLAHGWGYDRTLWNGVAARLADLPLFTLDLGFLGEPQHLDPAAWPDGPALGVGHSLGLLWLLRHGRARLPAMLAVNGFACFTARPDLPAGVPRRVVAAMARRAHDAPGEVLAAFRERSGAAGPGIERADPARLGQGLAWLREWDGRPALAGLDLAILAGDADPIVPPAMTVQALPGAAIEWVEGGHHVLPLQHPGLVAARIRRAWERLRP